MSKKTLALIPTAGYSSRMGFFKPLQIIQSSLVIEKTIQTFQLAGIEDIRVVVGYKGDLLIPVLERLGVQVIVNENYSQGMYSSIMAGVQTFEEDIEGFFLLPGDYPFICPETIKQLLRSFEDSETGDIIYPTYQEQRGHPPIISTRCCAAILMGSPAGGLRDLLDNSHFTQFNCPVNDAGSLIDLDTGSDYRHATQHYFVSEPWTAFPSKSECLDLLQKCTKSEKILLHSQKVARVACCIAEHLNSKGYLINLGLVYASGLLHDIGKGEPNHAQRGREVLMNLGYQAVAEIIGSHMDGFFESTECINEATIVYLADKIIWEDKIVSLDKRWDYSRSKYDDISIRQQVDRRFEKAIHIKKSIEAVLDQKIEEIVAKTF